MRVRIHVLLVGLMVMFLTGQAEARHKRHHHYRHYHHHSHNYINQSGTQYLSHPRGCPRTRFCACGAAVELFGRPIKSLWSTTAWLRFPRTLPAHGTAAVRRGGGHIFVLDRHVRGDVWWVKDYNSGGHRSRYHKRSIRGYAIVNPMVSRYARHGVSL